MLQEWGFNAGRGILVRIGGGVWSGTIPWVYMRVRAHVEHCFPFFGREQLVHVYLQIHKH